LPGAAGDHGREAVRIVTLPRRVKSIGEPQINADVTQIQKSDPLVHRVYLRFHHGLGVGAGSHVTRDAPSTVPVAKAMSTWAIS
jgi:hypothetical protein